MASRENPAAIESRRRIVESFLDLLQVKHIEDITVGEIVENAEVARKTFYRHFKSKEDVLEAYWSQLYDYLLSRLRLAGTNIGVQQGLLTVLQVCYENKDILYAFCNNNLQGFWLNKWNLALPELYQLFLVNQQLTSENVNDKELSYFLAFNVGGVFNIVMKWMNDGLQLSPEQLSAIIGKLILATPV